MIISAHQPAFNPWLGYLHKIIVSDIFVVMDDVQFEKNSYINRNKILQNDNEIMLTIPLKTKDYKNKSINRLEISDMRWKNKHIKTIEQSYRKTKNFEIVFKEIKNIYNIDSSYFIDYSKAFLNFILSYLNIKTKIIYASELNLHNRKQDYIIELTKKLNGRIFVFGEKGIDYVDIEFMTKNHIFPFFQNYNHPTYKQLSNDFHPYLGIIDLLFNVNKNQLIDTILLNNTKEEFLRSLIKNV